MNSVSKIFMGSLVTLACLNHPLSACASSSCTIPDCDTSFKSYMDYRTITDKTSEQYKLQQKAYTDDSGLRRINSDYCIAMGSGYSTEIGGRFEITLESGETFTAIVSDIKQDKHTDKTNRYTPVYDENDNFYSANILEFIIDTDLLDDMVIMLGSVDYYEYLNDNIEEIKRV